MQMDSICSLWGGQPLIAGFQKWWQVYLKLRTYFGSFLKCLAEASIAFYCNGIKLFHVGEAVEYKSRKSINSGVGQAGF